MQASLELLHEKLDAMAPNGHFPSPSVFEKRPHGCELVTNPARNLDGSSLNYENGWEP